MAENALSDMVELSRKLVNALHSHEKVIALISESWHEVESLEAYEEAAPKRKSKIGPDGEQKYYPVSVDFPLDGDLRYQFEETLQKVRPGVNVPVRVYDRGMALNRAFEHLWKPLSDYRHDGELVSATQYHLIQLYRVLTHAVSTLSDQSTTQYPLYQDRNRPDESLVNYDFDDPRAYLFAGKNYGALDNYWAMLRLTEIAEIFTGQPASYWQAGPIVAIWCPWLEYTVGFPFVAYRYELTHELGYYLYDRVHRDYIETRIRQASKDEKRHKKLNVRVSHKQQEEMRDGVRNQIASSIEAYPSGEGLLALLDTGGKIRVSDQKPSAVRGEKFHPVTYAPITGAILGDRKFVEDDEYSLIDTRN